MQRFQPELENYPPMDIFKPNQEIFNSADPALPSHGQFFEKINSHHSIISSPSVFRAWESPYTQDSQLGSEYDFKYLLTQETQNIMEYSKFSEKKETDYSDPEYGETLLFCFTLKNFQSGVFNLDYNKVIYKLIFLFN